MKGIGLTRGFTPTDLIDLEGELSATDDVTDGKASHGPRALPAR